MQLTGGGLRRVLVAAGDTFGLESFNIQLHLRELSRVCPNVLPVVRANTSTAAGTDSFKHELGGVGILGALGTISGQVVAKNLGVGSNVTKVDGFASGFQQQQAVEVLEQQGRRLMDGADDGLGSQI